MDVTEGKRTPSHTLTNTIKPTLTIKKRYNHSVDREDFFISILKTQNKSDSKKSAYSIGDDSVVINTNSKLITVTTDNTIEGIHFTKKAQIKDIIHKSLKRSVTDTIATGALPKYLMLSTIFPSSFNKRTLKICAREIIKFTKLYQMKLIGGDTSFHKGAFIISSTIIGTLIKKAPLCRSGAAAGDFIYVTGKIGCAVRSNKHLIKTVNIRKMTKLIKSIKITSMIDITDGFVKDLSRITSAYNKGAMIYLDKLPLENNATLLSALYEGEDYEFIFTSPHNIKSNKFTSNIGVVTKNKGIFSVYNTVFKRLPVEGWQY